jgi:vacuolar protein sorting-associated protein IST1
VKLQVAAPDSFLVERYLEEIARAYDIKWKSNILIHESDEEEEKSIQDDSDDDIGGGGGGGQAEVSLCVAAEKS